MKNKLMIPALVVLAQAGALGAQEIARASDLIRQARMNREAFGAGGLGRERGGGSAVERW